MRILLLDTNLADLTVYQYLVKLGLEVFVAGINNADMLIFT